MLNYNQEMKENLNKNRKYFNSTNIDKKTFKLLPQGAG